jgi:hypothetical protein
MALKEKILEIVGDETKANEIVSSLGEFMIPKEQYNKKINELTAIKTERDTFAEQIESEKLSKLSEKEKYEHELKKLEETKRDYSKKSNLMEAKALFSSKGVNADDYMETLESIVSHDAETTKKVVGGVLDMIVKQTENAVQKTKETSVNNTPKPNTTQNVEPNKFVKKPVY